MERHLSRGRGLLIARGQTCCYVTTKYNNVPLDSNVFTVTFVALRTRYNLIAALSRVRERTRSYYVQPDSTVPRRCNYISIPAFDAALIWPEPRERERVCMKTYPHIPLHSPPVTSPVLHFICTLLNDM